MAKPNIILIMTDSQGAEMVSCYSKQDLQTPNLDKLASDGIRFNSAYTTCPVCSPARAGIFSGLYPSKSGPFTNNLSLGTDIRHMGQIFTANGYSTAYIGKWHLDGHDYFDKGTCPDGWDKEYWYDGRNYLNDLSDEQITLWRQGLKSPESLREHRITEEFTWGGQIAARAERFIGEQPENSPFLLAVSFDEPHGPFTCPPEYAEAFRDFRFERGPGACDNLENKPVHHRMWAGDRRKNLTEDTSYSSPMKFGCNSFTDHLIGRVADAASSLENTYIIYTSDHGDMHGSHGLSSKGPCMYDEITRVPLIVKGPGIDKNTVQSNPVSHIDIMPTLMDLAGLKQIDILDGKNLVSGQNSGDAVIEFHRHSLCHDSYGGFIPVRCIVTDEWKLVINLHQTDELYSRKNDQAELTNLINQPGYEDIRNSLLDQLLDRMDELRDPFRGMCWENRPWRTEKTRVWKGEYRMKPDDGYSPTPLVYATGFPEK